MKVSQEVDVLSEGPVHLQYMMKQSKSLQDETCHYTDLNH